MGTVGRAVEVHHPRIGLREASARLGLEVHPDEIALHDGAERATALRPFERGWACTTDAAHRASASWHERLQGAEVEQLTLCAGLRIHRDEHGRGPLAFTRPTAAPHELGVVGTPVPARDALRPAASAVEVGQLEPLALRGLLGVEAQGGEQESEEQERREQEAHGPPIWGREAGCATGSPRWGCSFVVFCSP